MGRKLRGRRAAVVVTVAALASLGAVDVTLVTSGSGTAPELAVAAAAQSAAAPAGQPAPAPAVPSVTPSAPAATTATAAPAVTEQPPPVVDGVRRTDVGSAHSPRLLQQLAAAPATMPAPADAGALGVDVADYQHPHGAPIDWPQVAAAGYKFAFVKATEGGYYANPYYASDLAQSKAAGLYAAGYHFAIPNVSDGASQADYAVGNGGYAADGRTLPPALDIEYNPYGAECYGLSAAQMVGWISAFTAEEQRLTGQRPVIYTTADWWGTCTGDSTAFAADPLWVAAYRDGSPPMPAGWGNWTFWQYTSRATVPGITGHVDVSYFLQAAVRLLDPGSQQNAAGTAVQLQVSSLNAAGGQSPRFAASGLPPGLSISGSGLITGTVPAAAAGTYQVTVTAASPAGATGAVAFLWTVTAGQPAPLPSPTAPLTAPPSSPSSSPSPSPFLLPPSDSPAPSPSDPAPSDPASAAPTDPVADSPSPAGPAPSDPASPAGSPSPPDSPSPSPSASACASPSDSPADSASPSPTDSAAPCGPPSPSDSPSAAGSALLVSPSASA